jgi:four helix bundle protein
MTTYKDLEIYKLSHKLAVEIHKMTLKELPKLEMYEEGSQIRRSSKSVVNTIVEGFGRRRYKQEFIQFLTYSLASCEHLELPGSLKNKVHIFSAVISAQITKFIEKTMNPLLWSLFIQHRVSRIEYQSFKVSSICLFSVYPVSRIQHRVSVF